LIVKYNVVDIGTTISRVLSLGSYLSRRMVTHTLKRDTNANLMALWDFLPCASCYGQGLPSYLCYHRYWWSLTPPFHLWPSKRNRGEKERETLFTNDGRLLSVALALRLL